MHGTNLLILIALLFVTPAIGQQGKVPAELLANYTLKLASFEKNISNLMDASIYVMGDEQLADVLIEKRGEKIGKASLEAVMKSNELPAFKVTILFIADAANLDAAIKFARENKVLTITSIPELVNKGVTLGIGSDAEGKVQVLLNMTSSKEEGLEWNPAIMKIAKTVQ